MHSVTQSPVMYVTTINFYPSSGLRMVMADGPAGQGYDVVKNICADEYSSCNLSGLLWESSHSICV